MNKHLCKKLIKAHLKDFGSLALANFAADNLDKIILTLAHLAIKKPENESPKSPQTTIQELEKYSPNNF